MRVRCARPDPGTAITTFTWRYPKAATAYRLVIARDSDFSRRVVSRLVSSTSLPVRGLAVGRYYWRAEALDDDDAPVSVSQRATFSIAVHAPR